MQDDMLWYLKISLYLSRGGECAGSRRFWDLSPIVFEYIREFGDLTVTVAWTMLSVWIFVTFHQTNLDDKYLYNFEVFGYETGFVGSQFDESSIEVK